MKPCKYCNQGLPVRNGEHWLVKSISPAHITVVKCSEFIPAYEPKFIRSLEDLK